MSKEFIVNVYLQGLPGLQYVEDEYMYPPIYTSRSFPHLSLTDYRKEVGDKLEKLFKIDDTVLWQQWLDSFNQPAKVVIWEDMNQLTLALYDTDKAPTQRFLIHTDKTTEIGIYDYRWQYFNWLNEKEFTYLAVYDIP